MNNGVKRYASEEYVDNNINSTVAIKTFPISETYTSGIFTFARTNIFDLIKNQVYHTIPVEGIDGWYLSVPCTDGTFKNICLLGAGCEYRVLYDDTKANVYSFNDNVYYLADYTDKSTSSAVIITKTKNYYYLSTNNTTEYTPTGDYNPATKKYVDNAVAANEAVFTVNITENEDDEGNITYSADKTFAEIVEAHESGKVVNACICIDELTTHVLHLINVFHLGLRFGAIDGDFYMQLLIDFDEKIELNSGYLMAEDTRYGILTTTDKTIVGAINEVNAKHTEGTDALILLSPNGTKFSITVGDDGVLTATEITE